MINKAQGTIEYLVIIGVVIVIALIVVGLLITQVSNSQQVSASSNDLGLKSQSIGITESLVSSVDGNFVVRLLNNSGETITISNVKVGDSNVNFSEDMAQGSSRFFNLNPTTPCTEGKIVSQNVVITYVTRDSLSKTINYPSQVMFDCTPYTIAQANLANQCPVCEECVECEVCVDPVELHSGQIASYDSGALDDKEQDGNAKSYTINGDGTVTDNDTGLMWQKDGTGYMTWEDALSFCDLNTVGGYTDWRLPTIVELVTFADYACSTASANCNNRYINIGFNAINWGAGVAGYWSSTTVPNDTTAAYYLNYTYGTIVTYAKTGGYNTGTRCVRSA